MNKVTISVVMPVYNAENYLKEAIESILNQTYEDFEFVIINDGSKDKSLDIIEKYIIQDERIVIINKENSGIVDSLNDGLKLAKGKYIARMDSDDIAYLNRLEKQLKVFQKDDSIDLVYTDTMLIDKDGHEICKSWRPDLNKTLRNLENHNFIPHPSVMFKKNTIVKLGCYTKKRLHAEDLDLWLRMVANNAKFYYLDEALLYYRLNPNSVRPGIYDDYWYKMANYAIGNCSRSKAIKYLNRIGLKKKIIILMKLMLPCAFFHRKLK